MQSPLPVDRHVDEIVALVASSGRAVVVAPPGAGKTTRIPPALTRLGPTILLQPRRVAARALARRIAAEQEWTIGREIGWQIRFERRFGPETRLLVATEGILTARLQSDPLLSDFRVVVLDEFHERSIHADVALALARQAAEVRDDLALVVMSATIDAQAVSRFLGGARVVTVDARPFPVDVRYEPSLTVASAVRGVAAEARGHVLCFLPGAREIERARLEIGLPNVLPLHGSLDVDAQERALAPSAERKIILATNVAETSLTVEGVTDVVDSGLHRILRFDDETAIDHLVTEQIPLDSADQRAGRAGRTGPGRVTRLWDARQILRAHREAEVHRVDLASPVLDVVSWGADPRTFEWFERPADARIERAIEVLRRLGAVEGEERLRLTPVGEMLRAIPLHPRLARVLVAAHGAAAALRVCALLGEDLRRAGAGDALALADDRRLDPAVLQLEQVARRALGRRYRAAAGDEEVRRALLAGYPDRVAMRREPGSPRLLLSSGTGAVLGDPSVAREAEFLVALDVAGSVRPPAGAPPHRGGAVGERVLPAEGEALVRIASPVEREWLVPTHTDVAHSIRGDRVRATKRFWYGSILLREVATEPDAGEVRKLTAARLRESIDPELQRRLAFARIDVDWEALIGSTGQARLPYDAQKRLEKLAPERLPLPSGRSARIDYREDGAVVVSAKLQELFGLAESPRIGPDRVPVTFALLSPGGRPVQVTRDLRSFWDGAYQEVRREMRALPSLRRTGGPRCRCTARGHGQRSCAPRALFVPQLIPRFARDELEASDPGQDLLDRAAPAGVHRRVAGGVLRRLGLAQLLHEVQELVSGVGFEGHDEVLVVEAERVGGVDLHPRVLVADGDVLVHDPLALGHRQQVPVPRLDERVDEEERPLSRDDPQPPPLLSLVHVLLDVLRVLRHGEVGVVDVEEAAEARVVDVGGHLLERLEVVADPPEHEVDPGLHPHRRVGEDHHRALVAADDVGELAPRLLLLLRRQRAKGAVDAEEDEVDELAGGGGARPGRGLRGIGGGGHGGS